MFFHVFAQTTHVVAAPHGFACVVIPATRLYISSFIKIRSGVSEPWGVKIWPFSLLWLVAFTTACITVQAVIIECHSNTKTCAASLTVGYICKTSDSLAPELITLRRCEYVRTMQCGDVLCRTMFIFFVIYD